MIISAVVKTDFNEFYFMILKLLINNVIQGQYIEYF
jgi:hypothetical protein